MNKMELSLTELIDAAKEEMINLDYSPKAIEQVAVAWKQLEAYAGQNNVTFFNQDLVDSFLKDKFNYPFPPDSKHVKLKTIKTKIKAFRKLEWIKNYSCLVKGAVIQKAPLPVSFQNILSNYSLWGSKRAYSKTTLKHQRERTRKFIDYLIDKKITTCVDIEFHHVSDYIITLSGHAQSTLKAELSVLRSFLRFLYLENHHSLDLTDAVPNFHYRSSSLSKIWSEKEIEQLLASIDRGSPLGKRDYAIFLTAIELGVRDGDIRNLKLNDIHWENCSIEFTQSKTHNPIVLPLSEKLGLSIIDYLKYGRPETIVDNLFVKHVPPYNELGRAGTSLDKYIKRAGIHTTKEARHGMHSFRHTIATKLLDVGTPIDTIIPFLGHSDDRTIHKYLEMDIKNLRMCALSFEKEDSI